MAAVRRSKQSPDKVKTDTNSNNDVGRSSNNAPFTTTKEKQKQELDKIVQDEKNNAGSSNELVAEYLPPLLLVFTVLICSGALWILALRDVLATGRNIAGPIDEAMLLFTKSTVFFDDSRGWKSTQGGLSSVKPITTDSNNMGGLFIRKVGGVAALAVHTQKLLPLLFHPDNAQWTRGHFKPLLYTAIIGNAATATLYGLYMKDLAAADADGLAMIICTFLIFESLVILLHLLVGKKKSTNARVVTLPEGKKPTYVVSRIVTKTVTVVSGFFGLIFARDLLLPGRILDVVPRDDIYLEWTGAFLHSPPPGSQEAFDHGMEAPLFIGDKFLSQMLGLHMLILTLYKFVTAYLIRLGKDGSGTIKCRMIWKSQAIGNLMTLGVMRLFSGAASSASLDLRWHLMLMGYETIVLGLYGFF